MKRLLFACLLLLAGVLPACQFDPGIVVCEDGSGTGASDTVPTTLSQLHAQLGAPVQKLTYDPSRTNTFTGAKGTVITIPANAFLKNGRVVTSPVPLSFREIFSRADMVLSSMPTVSGGRLLESAGEVYLRADSTFQLAAGATIQLLTQNPANLASPDSMRLFVGNPGSGPGCFNWLLNQDLGSSLSQTGTGNLITISSVLYNQGVGWLNCDRFYPNFNARTTLTVKVTGGNIDPSENTMVFAVFRTFNGSLRVCDFNYIDTFTTPNVPTQLPVSVVVIQTLNGKLYYGRQDGTVQPGTTFSPVVQQTTPAGLVAELNKL